jgi:DnaJ-class molecular chaperone
LRNTGGVKVRVVVNGTTECLLCDGTGYDKIDKDFYDEGVPCAECHGKGKIPTLTYKEVSAEDQVTEQINEWYNGR